VSAAGFPLAADLLCPTITAFNRKTRYEKESLFHPFDDGNAASCGV